jgi:hypothetical protein
MNLGLGLGVGLGAFSPMYFPPLPPLPSVSALDLYIDSGRTIAAGHLTDWSDQGHSIALTPPGGSTAPAVSAAVFQQFDGQIWASSTDELSNVATTLFTAGQACTVVMCGECTDAGGAIGTALRVGSAGKSRVFIAGGGYCYSDGTTNITVPNLYLGSPFVMSWSITPGTGGMTLRLNGWPLVYPNTTSALSGTPGIDDGSSGIQVGNRDDAPTLYFHGYEQEIHAYARILNASDQRSVEGNLATKFNVVGVSGYVSDSAAISFYAIGDEHMLFLAPFASTRFVTKATSITLEAQQNTGAGVTTTNRPELVVLVDGVVNEVYTVPTSASPYAPTSTTLTLDGREHVVEIWDGPPVSGVSATTPVGAALSSIQDSTGSTRMLPALIPANRLTVFSDSIALGCGTTTIKNGAFQMLRYIGAQWEGRISFFGGIGRGIITDHDVDATFVATATALVALAQEVAIGGAKVIWWQVSLNDFVSATYASAAAWKSDAALLIAAIHAIDASVQIVLQGAIVAAGESVPNSSGYTLPNLRTAMSQLAASNPSFVSYVDASQAIGSTPAVTLSELNVDGYHPTDAGHIAYKAWIVAAMTELGLPVT